MFSFAQKTQKLDWNYIESVDVSQLIERKDIRQLESLLANITYANISKGDLKQIRDKNLIKLVKTGQLSIEYLIYT